MPRPPTPSTIDPDGARRVIEQTLREVAQLASEGGAPAEFYAEVLPRVVSTTAAQGAAVWIVGAGGRLHLLQKISEPSRSERQRRAAVDAERSRLTDWLACWEEGRVGSATPVVATPDGALALVSRIAPGGSLWGLLVVQLGPSADPAMRAGLQRFVDAVAQQATEHQALRELRHWNQDRDALSRLHDLAMAIHRPWSQRRVMAEVVTEGRRFLDADRVLVAVRRSGRYRVAAASGAAELNRRSLELQRLEALLPAVARTGEPFAYEEAGKGASDAASGNLALPHQLQEPLNAYLDESATRRMVILPLFPEETPPRDRKPLAMLVIEQMSDRPLDASSQAVRLLAEHAGVAVERAARIRRVPVVGRLLSVPSARAAITRRWAPRGLLAATVVAALVAALCLIRVEHAVRVTGELVPQSQRHLFAPADGVVTQLAAEHGKRVAAGDLLATLRSPELDLEQTRVDGALAAARQALAAARTAQLEAAVANNPRRTTGEAASEVLLAEQRAASLVAQQQLLDEQRRRLRVTSPMAGSVVTWGLRESLAGQPVARGQQLMTVADLEGGWLLRFRVPDRRAGALLDAKRQSLEGLDLRFVTAGRPEVELAARTVDFRLAAETDVERGENVVVFDAQITGDAGGADLDLRPGAEVIGMVNCGRRPLGYVWLGELYQELRRRFF